MPRRHGGDVARTLVGAGGWGYFSGGLGAYARAFEFAEVNTTFYRRVSEATARRWRSSAPEGFTFAVKAHRDTTHRAGLRATAAARTAFAQTADVARLLRAPFLILETPACLPLGREAADGLREFAALAPPGARLGLEARAHAEGPLPPPLVRTMEDLDILDVVDLSRRAPRVAADALYTRIFGRGEFNAYQLDDEEMRAIDRAGRGATTVAYAFHGVRMYQDAARFLSFRRTGVFPPVTGSEGLASLAEVLEPDARFPAAREDLIRDHGWKLVDLDATRRARAEAYLARLPPGTYRDLPGVLRALGAARGRADPEEAAQGPAERGEGAAPEPDFGQPKGGPSRGGLQVSGL